MAWYLHILGWQMLEYTLKYIIWEADFSVFLISLAFLLLNFDCAHFESKEDNLSLSDETRIQWYFHLWGWDSVFSELIIWPLPYRGSFCVCAQPMKDNVTMQHPPSLAGCIHRKIPAVLSRTWHKQSGTKPNLVAKTWPPTLVTICNGLPKLVANISSHNDHLVNTGLDVGSLVKWLPIKVATPANQTQFEWFIARRL